MGRRSANASATQRLRGSVMETLTVYENGRRRSPVRRPRFVLERLLSHLLQDLLHPVEGDLGALHGALAVRVLFLLEAEPLGSSDFVAGGEIGLPVEAGLADER